MTRTREENAADLAREEANRQEMINHLKAAVALGFTMATPGSHDAVRAAFPELFASEAEAGEVNTNDDLETDDYPMISRGDDGYWISTWSWVACDPGQDEED